MTTRRRVIPEYHGMIPPDHLFFDIETLPTDDPDDIAEITARIKIPGSMKKAETIAEWEKNDKPNLITEAVGKSGLDATYGRICCISWAFGDQPTQVDIGVEAEVIWKFFLAVNEYSTLTLVHRVKEAVIDTVPLTVIGHNIYSFDLRFVWQRAVVNDLTRPVRLPWKAKQWDDRIQDTLLQWNPDTSRRISLGRLCRVLGVQHMADDFDGSQVASAWAAGRKAKIAAYCQADVEAARLCWFRMKG